MSTSAFCDYCFLISDDRDEKFNEEWRKASIQISEKLGFKLKLCLRGMMTTKVYGGKIAKQCWHKSRKLGFLVSSSATIATNNFVPGASRTSTRATTSATWRS